MFNKNRPSQAVLALMAVLIVIFGLQPNNTMGSFTAQITGDNTAGFGIDPDSDEDTTPAPNEDGVQTCEGAISASAEDDGLFAYQLRRPTDGQYLKDLSDNEADALVHVPSSQDSFASPCARDTPRSLHFPGGQDDSFVSSMTQQPGVPVDFTGELWLRTTQESGTLMGFYNQPMPAAGAEEAAFKLDIHPDSGGVVLNFAGKEFATLVSNTAIVDGQWHHIAFTRDNSGAMEIFTDGQLTASGTSPAPVIDFPGYFRLSCDSLTDWPELEEKPLCFEGDMAFAAGYARVLSDAEIAAHYEARK